MNALDDDDDDGIQTTIKEENTNKSPKAAAPGLASGGAVVKAASPTAAASKSTGAKSKSSSNSLIPEKEFGKDDGVGRMQHATLCFQVLLYSSCHKQANKRNKRNKFDHQYQAIPFVNLIVLTNTLHDKYSPRLSPRNNTNNTTTTTNTHTTTTTNNNINNTPRCKNSPGRRFCWPRRTRFFSATTVPTTPAPWQPVRTSKWYAQMPLISCGKKWQGRKCRH